MIHEISIAALLKKLDKDIESYPDILDAMYENVKDLAEQIQKDLTIKRASYDRR